MTVVQKEPQANFNMMMKKDDQKENFFKYINNEYDISQDDWEQLYEKISVRNFIGQPYTGTYNSAKYKSSAYEIAGQLRSRKIADSFKKLIDITDQYQMKMNLTYEI